jgi:hypothetical protein
VEIGVEESEIKKQIEDLRRQRREALENLAGVVRHIRGEFNEEPEVAPEDAGEGYGEDKRHRRSDGGAVYEFDDDDWYEEEAED